MWSRFKAWRRRRRFQKTQLAHLRAMLIEDGQWLAHDPVASELVARYLRAASPDWHLIEREPVHRLRARLGLEFKARPVNGWVAGVLTGKE